jgi:hypothetical protein
MPQEWMTPYVNPETGRLRGSFADTVLIEALRGGATQREIVGRAVEAYLEQRDNEPTDGAERDRRVHQLRQYASRIIIESIGSGEWVSNFAMQRAS